LLVQVVEDVKGDLFQTPLQARRDVALAISERRSLLAGRAEGSLELVGEDTADCGRAFVPAHLDALGVVSEVVQVQAEAPALVRAYDVAELLHEARGPVRREAHHLPLVAVVGEAEELCGRRVKYPRRVRVLDLPQHL